MSKSFLQSFEWSNFQKSLGRKVFLIENKLVIKYPLPMGLSYLYCPRASFSNQTYFRKFITLIKKVVPKENAVFLRIEPDLKSNTAIKPFDKTRGKQYSNIVMKLGKCAQPQDTLILDLKKSTKKILSEMHPKTRYNIRLAEKHKVKIIKTTDPKDIDIFYNLALTTSRRDGFSYHEREYYKKMLEILGKRGMVKLYIAYNDTTPLAANLVLFYQKTVIYLHGASDHSQRQFMAPYLLQWQAIKDAKKNGFNYYDFWGIAPADDPGHSWAGVTRFKNGFAPQGQIIHYQPCQELIFRSFWYKLYGLAKHFQ